MSLTKIQGEQIIEVSADTVKDSEGNAITVAINNMERASSIDLVKTNFKLAQVNNLGRAAVGSVFVDDFTDTTGIDGAKSSNWAFDSINGLITATTAPCIVQTSPETISVVPSRLIVIAEGTNLQDCIFRVSRNGGISFTRATLEQFVFITGQSSGQDIVIQVELTGDLYTLGFAYK